MGIYEITDAAGRHVSFVRDEESTGAMIMERSGYGFIAWNGERFEYSNLPEYAGYSIKLVVPGVPVSVLTPLVRRVEDERLLPAVPVRTVGDLATILANLPPGLPLSAEGSDSGGYDCIIGSEVFVDIIDGALHIAHVDSDRRADVLTNNEWHVRYEESQRKENAEDA